MAVPLPCPRHRLLPLQPPCRYDDGEEEGVCFATEAWSWATGAKNERRPPPPPNAAQLRFMAEAARASGQDGALEAATIGGAGRGAGTGTGAVVSTALLPGAEAAVSGAPGAAGSLPASLIATRLSPLSSSLAGTLAERAALPVTPAAAPSANSNAKRQVKVTARAAEFRASAPALAAAPQAPVGLGGSGMPLAGATMPPQAIASPLSGSKRPAAEAAAPAAHIGSVGGSGGGAQQPAPKKQRVSKAPAVAAHKQQKVSPPLLVPFSPAAAALLHTLAPQAPALAAAALASSMAGASGGGGAGSGSQGRGQAASRVGRPPKLQQGQQKCQEQDHPTLGAVPATQPAVNGNAGVVQHRLSIRRGWYYVLTPSAGSFPAIMVA